MAQYRKKPVVIEAHQWFKNGDHPDDAFHPVDSSYPNDLRTEGSVVRYFRRPDIGGEQICSYCKREFHIHGWIDTKEGGHIVCPRDWIITGIQGEHYPCKPDIFAAIYDPA